MIMLQDLESSISSPKMFYIVYYTQWIFLGKKKKIKLILQVIIYNHQRGWVGDTFLHNIIPF